MVVNVVHPPRIYIPRCYHGVIGILKKLKYQSQNPQNRRSSEKVNHMYETYKNTVMPQGIHIYAKAYDMEKAKMCTYTQSDHALPHWKGVLLCCAKLPCVNLPDQETCYQYSDTSPSILFHIYYLILCYTKYGSIPLNDKKSCCMCKKDSASEESTHI